jgi:hypothetical protein
MATRNSSWRIAPLAPLPGLTVLIFQPFAMAYYGISASFWRTRHRSVTRSLANCAVFGRIAQSSVANRNLPPIAISVRASSAIGSKRRRNSRPNDAVADYKTRRLTKKIGPDWGRCRGIRNGDVASDSISTRQRSFLGHCEAIPTNRRLDIRSRQQSRRRRRLSLAAWW